MGTPITGNVVSAARTRQMSRHPGHGNDDLYPRAAASRAVGLDALGGAVGRSHHHLKGNARILEQHAAG